MCLDTIQKVQLMELGSTFMKWFIQCLFSFFAIIPLKVSQNEVVEPLIFTTHHTMFLILATDVETILITTPSQQQHKIT